ncbi:MAG: hypothetical protein AB7L76_14040, partial [Burkholderiaceae bacterium]
MSRRILHVVTNVAHYEDPSQPTGLWMSELTHAWHVFAVQGYEQRIVSPKGGLSPLEPRSLKWPLADPSVKAWLPFVSNVVVDGRLVTGQNPQSAKATAERVVALL